MTSSRLVCGIGRAGSGIYKASRKHGKAYGVWYHMLWRCYMKDENRKPGCFTYKGCTVCEEWLNFQNFAKWFYENKVDGFHLDKDIIKPGNKIYCPEFCGFVPAAINTCLTHASRKGRKYDLPSGVSFCSRTNKYYASIQEKGKSVNIGKFQDIQSARNAYLSRKKVEVIRLADKYRGQISEMMYQALLVFPVEMEK